MLEKIGIGILTILTKVVSVFSKEAWERLKNKRQNSKSASHDYNSPYKKRHGQLQASYVGIDPSRSLDDIYVAVQFLNKRRTTKHTSLEEVEEEFRESARTDFTSTSDERQDGMRFANDEQYLMVLGGPGVGKSTFLRKVGVEALKGEDGNFEHQCIPVFLELRRFTEDPVDIKAWITEEFKVCGHPYPEQWANSKLKSGELLILFDGLDEVPKPNVSNVINKIKDFAHEYSRNRFVVSCRVGDYTGRLADFTVVVEMADFDDSQIQAYINNWFASASDQKKKTAQRCWKALNTSDHQAIKVLAQNPLSLALLCQVYEDSQDFPASQVILYEKILNIFLKKWTAEKGVHRDLPMSPYLAIPTVKELLSEIAAENFKADRLIFSENELINQIQEFYQRRGDISSGFDASEILDSILVDPGLFVERASGIYSFSHLTFQEYLTANHNVRYTRSIQDLVNQHLHDDRWREVFLLTSGLMPKTDDLLIAMEAEAAKLINTDGLRALFQWAERITDTSNYRYNGIAKRSFALYQYFSLHLFNKTYKVVENSATRYPSIHRELHSYLDFNRDFDRYLDLHRHPPLYLDLDLYRDLDPYRDPYRDLDLGQDLDLELYLYVERYQELDLYLDLYRNRDLGFYKDFYRYTDANFFLLVPDESRDQCDKELQERILLAKRLEQMEIFKGVDLQQMGTRFNEQREFIQAAAARKDVEYPAKSIHDTWLSVFGITDEMLHISPEELDTCLQYLRAVDLIVACKEAAGRVSPKVWQKIEEKLLSVKSSK